MTRGTNPEVVRELATLLFPNPTPLEHDLLTALLGQFSIDTEKYSDILEWSISEDENGVDMARFSYAFPGLKREPDVTMAALHQVLYYFDRYVPGISTKFLRAAQVPCVEQVLVGLARGCTGTSRAKLYLQFTAEHKHDSLRLSQKILGVDLSLFANHLPLRHICIDLGKKGIVGAKLYFLDTGLSAKAYTLGFGQISNAILVHRLSHPRDPIFFSPTEINFSLKDNPHVLAKQQEQSIFWPYTQLHETWQHLSSTFRLRPRWITTGLDGRYKRTLYYVVD